MRRIIEFCLVSADGIVVDDSLGIRFAEGRRKTSPVDLIEWLGSEQGATKIFLLGRILPAARCVIGNRENAEPKGERYEHPK